MACYLAWTVACTGALAAGAPAELSLADAIARPVGPRGLQFSPAWLAHQGETVRVTGHFVRQERPRAGHFLLASNPVRLSEDADGDADDLPPAVLMVVLPDSQRERIVQPPDRELTLQGRLSLGRALLHGRVTWLRLQLDEDALERQPSAQP